jgi:hypothetical protein
MPEYPDHQLDLLDAAIDRQRGGAVVPFDRPDPEVEIRAQMAAELAGAWASAVSPGAPAVWDRVTRACGLPAARVDGPPALVPLPRRLWQAPRSVPRLQRTFTRAAGVAAVAAAVAALLFGSMLTTSGSTSADFTTSVREVGSVSEAALADGVLSADEIAATQAVIDDLAEISAAGTLAELSLSELQEAATLLAGVEASLTTGVVPTNESEPEMLLLVSSVRQLFAEVNLAIWSRTLEIYPSDILIPDFASGAPIAIERSATTEPPTSGPSTGDLPATEPPTSGPSTGDLPATEPPTSGASTGDLPTTEPPTIGPSTGDLPATEPPGDPPDENPPAGGPNAQ